MSPQLFPIYLSAYDNGHFIEMANDFRPLMLEIKPPGLTWYCFDVTINSPTSVTFDVRTMADAYYGGIGGVVGSFTHTDVDPKITRPAIERYARYLAEGRRLEELEAAEAAIINSYAQEILKCHAS